MRTRSAQSMSGCSRATSGRSGAFGSAGLQLGPVSIAHADYRGAAVGGQVEKQGRVHRHDSISSPGNADGTEDCTITAGAQLNATASGT